MIWSVCLNRQYLFKFFKGCLPQILFGPFLTHYLTHCKSSGGDQSSIGVLDISNSLKMLFVFEGKSTTLDALTKKVNLKVR